MCVARYCARECPAPQRAAGRRGAGSARGSFPPARLLARNMIASTSSASARVHDPRPIVSSFCPTPTRWQTPVFAECEHRAAMMHAPSARSCLPCARAAPRRIARRQQVARSSAMSARHVAKPVSAVASARSPRSPRPGERRARCATRCHVVRLNDESPRARSASSRRRSNAMPGSPARPAGASPSRRRAEQEDLTSPTLREAARGPLCGDARRRPSQRTRLGSSPEVHRGAAITVHELEDRDADMRSLGPMPCRR